jgi:hypothetical protein
VSADRREFLQATMTVGMFAFAYSSVLLPAHSEAASAPTPAPKRFVLLRSSGDEAFARSAAEAGRRHLGAPPAEVALGGELAADSARLHATLQSYRGLALIGLMDDFTHILFEESVRDFHGAVVCRGRHRAVSSSCAASCHTLTTTARSSGVGAALAGALAQDGADLLVQEDCCEGAQGAGYRSRRTGRIAPIGRTNSWGEALGAAFAHMALGLWTPRPIVARAGRGTSPPQPRSRAFVSLVAQL